ncbi:Sec1-like protein [Cantharellus anzutake]|uniref:Sec1-like protein n=1 Tax=Cantharellus anzutake TaxID=1750568 RepID=UPI001906A8F8|nr:Sec1-like protein [Cantharellus anzutake]KAF8336635.1 Sec1-like protein [Cantharellus anzutake]
MATPATATHSHEHPEAGKKSKLENEALGQGILDLSMLKTLAQRALVDALNAVNGAKTLVLDPSLAGPLSLVTEVSLLKHHGVDKMFWLEPGPLNASTANVVYLCRPEIKWMKMIADQIKQSNASSTSHSYNIVLVPRRTVLCDRILEEEGVLGEVNISSYKLEFIPLEDDLISLELDRVWREIYLDGDESSIFYASQSLMTIQQAYGLFPRILGKGDGAKKLVELLVRSKPAPSSRTPATLTNVSEAIDSLIIIDRNVDLITPLLTQLTYEGLIDEFFSIQNSHVKVDAALLAAQQPATASPGPSTAPSLPGASAQAKKKHHLKSSDLLFAQLRDSNFAIVGGKLSKEARKLDTEYKNRHNAQTVTQLREFVNKLGGLQSEHQALRLHTGLSEEIAARTKHEHFNKSLEIQQNLLQRYDTSAQVSAIEGLVSEQAPMHIVTRLLCLANLTIGGIKVKILENLKREILQTYGYSYLPMFLSLTATGLISPIPAPKTAPAPLLYNNIRKALRLLSDTDESSPTDISFVYSGYAPLSVRLVQCVAHKTGVLSSPDGNTPAREGEGAATETPVIPFAQPINGWKGFEDAVKSIPGATVDRFQHGATPSNEVDTQTTSFSSVPASGRQTTTMVFFLGGCTFTEIAALRWLNTQMKGRRIVIGTTGIINGSKLLESLIDGPLGNFAPAT